MKVTYNWLREFVDFDLSFDQLADMLTMLGLEVEGMEIEGDGMDDVVIAVVEEKRQHPNADKLSLCVVNDGRERLNVVCGARNFSAGDTVVLARIGATLPGDFKIKRSKIRGEESCGMLCSEKELGLSEESSGIMVLSGDFLPGTPFFEATGKKDAIYEIGLTPNRADCLSCIGIAREIAAKLGTSLKRRDVVLQESEEGIDGRFSVIVQESEKCPRYAARLVTGCRIGPSPEWLVKRLNSAGVRSINNVVDITNLVMMELGQPLHAFDFDRISGGKIIVRNAVDAENFTTLDNQTRRLVSSDLVICDAERPVALAGIMGGLDSEISQETCTILLESACFKPAAIRSTARRLSLHTESSHRFERGVDPDGTVTALNRAASLIIELAGGYALRGVIDVKHCNLSQVKIKFRPEKANALLGISMERERMLSLLTRLNCVVEPSSADDYWIVSPPSYRMDMEREIDLIEEVARLNGFDNIPATMPLARVDSDLPTAAQTLERNLRNLLVAQGMNEVINFSFTSISSADKLMLREDDPRRKSVRLTNPLVDEHAIMRTTLLPGILESVARNHSFRSFDLQLFEIRRVYMVSCNDSYPSEKLCVAGAFTGARERESWCHERALVDFYDVKGVLENLFGRISLGNVRWVADSPEPYYHPGKSCSITVGRDRIGTAGEIHPAVMDAFRIEKPVYAFELDFEKLLELQRTLRRVTAPSRFPDSSRDIALLMLEETTAENVLDCIRSVRDAEIENVEIFDLYRGAGIPEGHKSIAVRITYRSQERTLTEDEINAFHGRIIERLVSRLNITVR